MTARRLLRGAAIAIAVACLIDPSFTREIERAEGVTVVATSASALPAAVALREQLSADAEARAELHPVGSAAAACPAEGQCVLVVDDELPAHVSAGASVLAVVDARTAPLIQRIDVPSRVHPDAVASLRVQTSRPVERIDVFDGETLVGSAAGAGTSVDIPWVPVATGARALRVVPISGTPSSRKGTLPAQGSTTIDARHVGVVIDAAAVPLLFYEPRATWLGTYVRRAIEDDSRFNLRGRARLAPPVAITRGERTMLNVASLEEVSTIIVTAPELLTGSEVTMLEDFISIRGGSLIVLTDQRPTGQSLRLLPRIVGEHREPQPREAGPLRATEWVTFENAVGVSSMAAIDAQPVVIARALGRGRVIVSGALDAWRYRAASNEFASFWTTMAWDAATVAGPRLRVRAEPVVARPGEEVRVTAELQGMSAGTDRSEQAFAARAQVTCGAESRFLRLWPDALPGSFRGSFRADSPSACAISVRVADASSAVPVTFRDDLPPRPSEDQRLEALAAAYDAAVVRDDGREDVSARVRESISTSASTTRVHPMRSPWWALPFALCLAGEWWLRRQSGLS